MKTITIAMFVALFPLAATARAPNPPATESCVGKPTPAPFDAEVYSIDGDTVAVLGGGPHLRIWGVQAPELRDRPAPGATGIETVAGMKSRAAMEDLLAPSGHRVHVEPTKWDLYCRVVAIVTADKSGDLALALLQAGMAYGFYLDDAVAGKTELSRRYADAEATARKERRGLWPVWLGEK